MNKITSDMHQDDSRNKLDVKMYCSKHPETELNFSPNSKVGAHSAYEINVKILIHPCRKCEAETNRIKNAISLFSEVAKEQLNNK